LIIIAKNKIEMNNMFFRRITIAFAGIAAILSISCSKTEEPDEQTKINNYLTTNKITSTPTASGLYYIEKNAGTGALAKAGNTVSVHYTGKLLDGTEFDSSIGYQPFTFVLGKGRVIAGWDEGIALMSKGGKAKLIIPSGLAYGSRANGSIPANSTLVFDVELISIK
jgi:FKBP-type peptidyl-prolyl cis-trans isomerase